MSLNERWQSQSRNWESRMSEKLLSVVIPTYNMEAYLRRCLDSVTRDDVPSSLELIVVNDGSTDGSLAIMQEYATKRSDIVNIIDKPNGHYGSCVNAALNIATGKYFRILDADDWYDTDGLIKLLNELENISADIIVTPYKKIRRIKTIEYKPKQVLYNHAYDLSQESIWTNQNFELFVMHSMSFRTSILRDVNLHLSEGICYTDNEFLIYPTKAAKSIIFLESLLYNYDMTREGQSMDPAVQAKNSGHLAIIIKRFTEWIDERDKFSGRFCSRVLISYYYRRLFACIDDNELKEIDRLVKISVPYLFKDVDAALLHAPSLWRKFGLHFLFYEKLKRAFNIDR